MGANLRGLSTRQRILDVAQDAVLAKGFEATSIDEIVVAVEITKSGFSCHFPDKNALAHALIDRYIKEENHMFDSLFGRARDLTDGPLRAMLVGLKLLSELWETFPAVIPDVLLGPPATRNGFSTARCAKSTAWPCWAGESGSWPRSGKSSRPAPRKSTSTRTSLATCCRSSAKARSSWAKR